jgi:hypothetical protein
MRRAHVLALGGLLFLAACDLSGPKVAPPAEISLSPVASGLQVGATVANITATVRDREGLALAGARVTWEVSHGSVSGSSTTDSHGLATATWTIGTVAGTQSITVRSGDVQATRSVEIAPGPLARVTLTPGNVTLHSVGDTVEFGIRGEDAHGNELATPGVTWSSSAPGVASVQGGLVISHGRGTAVITGTTSGMSGTATVVVDQVVAGLRVTPADPVLVVGETLPLSARAVDARGSAIDTTLALTWESSDPAVATVDQSGAVSALAAGTATVTVRSGGHSAATALRVSTDLRPTITSIAPAVLSAGDTATIRGTNFAVTASENQVTVAGVAAQVLMATATELRVATPPAGALPCGPTGSRPVVVSVAGLEARADHPVTGATQHTLAVGQSVALHGAGLACSELTRGGTYIVSVFSTSTLPTSQTGFLLRGTASTVAADATAAVQRRVHRITPAAAHVAPDPDAVAHGWLLEQNIRLARDLAARTTLRKRDTQALMVAASPVGTTRTFRIPDVSTSNLCGAYKTVTARAVYSGSTAAIWEDVAAPLSGQMDATWQEIGREYEQMMHPIILEYFGDPLAFDPWLANPGRVNMLFSREVNDFVLPGGGGALAFVTTADFFPRSSCASSDEMAIFYGRVPTVAGTGEGFTADAWAWQMRSTVIHEVKHIVSFATRLRAGVEGSRSPVYEAVWLEESTARLSEEFYARALMGYGQGDNVTYQESIWCERRGGAQCGHIPVLIHAHFAGVYPYYRNVENRSPIGAVVPGDATYYGSGWLLVRWAMDHSTMPEAAFSRALVQEQNRTGVDNLAARTGRSFRDMLADFTLAMMVDDYPGGLSTRPELSFPSWNTRDIMNGLFEDYSGTTLAQAYPVPWPLADRPLAFGDFDASVSSIRGGTATFFRLTGAPGSRQLLELLGSGGSAAPSALGVAIVRVQ